MTEIMGGPQGPEATCHRTKAAVRNVLEVWPIEPDPIMISDEEFEAVLGSLVLSSSHFVMDAQDRIVNRAKNLFETPTPSSEQNIKTTFSYRDFGRTKSGILTDTDAMAMVDRSLSSDEEEISLYCTGFPMKVFNPLETEYQGDLVDLGDVSALLRFAELAKVLTHFGDQSGKKFSVAVVSDGRLNSGMFKVGPEVSDSYVAKLDETIHRLGIEPFISVPEFFALLENTDQREAYLHTTETVKAEYHASFDSLLDPENLEQSIESALQVEDDEYAGSSFENIFHSTVGSVRYEGIERLSEEYDIDFLMTYSMILGSILWDREIEQSAFCGTSVDNMSAQQKMSFLEELRQEQQVTLLKAWDSTIEYMAVLAVNKATNVLDSFFPNGIRVTTRPKKGQIGVHTSDQTAPTLFSYHSVPVIVPCNKGKNVKLDFLLRSDALSSHYRPVILEGTGVMCYMHPAAESLPIEQLPWKRGSK